MNRRHFLELSATAGAAWPFAGALGDDGEAKSPLATHKIAALETRSLKLAYPRNVGRNAKLGNHGTGPTVTAVILKTDQGAVGWGELIGKAPDLDALRPVVMGHAVADLFAPDRGLLQAAYKPLDFALHDLAGIILGQPVWKLLGAESPLLTKIYSGMVYFDDLDPEGKPAGIDQIVRTRSTSPDRYSRSWRCVPPGQASPPGRRTRSRFRSFPPRPRRPRTPSGPGPAVRRPTVPSRRPRTSRAWRSPNIGLSEIAVFRSPAVDSTPAGGKIN